jgi:hypothetical protein
MAGTSVFGFTKLDAKLAKFHFKFQLAQTFVKRLFRNQLLVGD